MTTRSSPFPSNQPAIAFTQAIPSAEPLSGTSPAIGPGPEENTGPAGPTGHSDDSTPHLPTAPRSEEGAAGGGSYGDPVLDLVHAAVSARPLEEVVRLVTLMEESPEYAQTVVAVLRAVAVTRSVDDVARLVAELTRPPREADSADETIRAAIEGRCVEDVTRLMALLHQTPLGPHCGQAAVRAAATGRPVEELVELIGRLARQPYGVQPEQISGSTAQDAMASAALAPVPDVFPAADSRLTLGLRGRRTVRIRRHRPPAPPKRPVFWPSWLAAAALVVCGAACFPLHRQGTTSSIYVATLGASGACVLLAVLLALRTTVPMLMAGVALPATLAAAGLLEGRIHSAGLSRALHITLAPPWSAGLTAACASLASLAALLLLLMVQVADRYPAPRPVAEASRVTE
ncbi:hypothetical protein [Streptomyces sp. PSKA30]|uniref:hypothetical protein n=1 Tax=Streptomyces sp. PSKA30 TaxID=2874597 RepID=UPI001CD19060|nr:hypothetical protein [Streptomyces sp. PSKA30]MBZ9639377.1 hypothetical protein [Streptomyces sp. PSKA30]